MQIELTGRHVDITPALRNYVNEKLARIDRHHAPNGHVHVILSVEKLRHKAEATLHTAGHDIYADATEEDMYAAIDAMVDRLDRQLGKLKGRLHGRRA